MKRTPLRRGEVQMRRTRLNPRSAKMAAFYRNVRVPLVAEMLAGRPRCEFPLGCTAEATTVHELLNRAAGGSLTDPDNLRRSCRFHNGWAEDNPNRAVDIGWKRMRKAA